jgi:O-antigen/teichoic acid export membrane protein
VLSEAGPGGTGRYRKSVSEEAVQVGRPPAPTGRLPGRRRTVVLRLARRAGWSIVAQALSSLSNLLLSVFVARAVDAEGFGAFTIAFAVYSVLVLVCRALVSQPLGIRYADASPAEARSVAASSTGAAAALGLLLAAGVCAVALVIGGAVAVVLMVTAVFLPALLVQDVWRMAFFAQGRPQLAALIDGLWTILLLAGIAVLIVTDVSTATAYVVAWGAAATVATLVGAVAGRAWPHVAATWTWIRSHWGMTRFLLFEQLLTQGAYQGGLLIIGALSSLSTVASLRGAQVALGPVSMLGMSAMAFAVPELARRSWLTARQRIRIAVAVGGLLAAVGICWGTVVLLLPDAAGEAFLGDSWAGVRSVLLATLVGQVGNLFSAGATYVVYSRGATRAAFRVNATVSVLLVVFGLAGVQLGGAEGAAWGFTAAYLAVVPLWFLTLSRLGRAEANGNEGRSAVGGSGTTPPG